MYNMVIKVQTNIRILVMKFYSYSSIILNQLFVGSIFVWYKDFAVLLGFHFVDMVWIKIYFVVVWNLWERPVPVQTSQSTQKSSPHYLCQTLIINWKWMNYFYDEKLWCKNEIWNVFLFFTFFSKPQKSNIPQFKFKQPENLSTWNM